MKANSKSLYIGLGIFVAGILVTGAVSRYFVSKTNEISKNVVENQTVTLPTPQNTQEYTPPVVSVEPAATITSVAEEKPEPFLWQAPVKGELLYGYSGSELVYSKTLQDYRVHKGVDIKSTRLAPVAAVERGVVVRAYEDSFMGFTVRIDHENGFESVYSNLDSIALVQPDMRVVAGQVIGEVGASAGTEAADATHLHFEFYQNGKQVNPQDFISFSK